jgi:hypothetical protein
LTVKRAARVLWHGGANSFLQNRVGSFSGFGRVVGLHVEVDFSGFPIFVDLPQQRGLVGKDSGDSGAPLEFHVDPFYGIACPHAALMGRWQDHPQVVAYKRRGKFKGWDRRGNKLWTGER